MVGLPRGERVADVLRPPCEMPETRVDPIAVVADLHTRHVPPKVETFIDSTCKRLLHKLFCTVRPDTLSCPKSRLLCCETYTRPFQKYHSSATGVWTSQEAEQATTTHSLANRVALSSSASLHIVPSTSIPLAMCDHFRNPRAIFRAVSPRRHPVVVLADGRMRGSADDHGYRPSGSTPKRTRSRGGASHNNLTVSPLFL